jgi:hypothetical protein
LIPRSALFENYDEDLKLLLASLKGKLEGDVRQLEGGECCGRVGVDAWGSSRAEQRKAALKKVGEELDEAEEIVSSIGERSQLLTSASCRGPSVVLLSSVPYLDRPNGGRATVYAGLYQATIPGQTSELQAGP